MPGRNVNEFRGLNNMSTIFNLALFKLNPFSLANINFNFLTSNPGIPSRNYKGETEKNDRLSVSRTKGIVKVV